MRRSPHPLCWMRRNRPALLTLTVVALSGLLVPGLRTGPRAAAQSATTVQYHAGWNLVAAPTGTVFEKALAPAYALDPGANAYRVVQPGELVAGRSVWLFFPQDTTVTLGRTAAAFSRILVPPGTYMLAGNPTAGEVAAISGADAAFAYDPQTGYTPVQELQPGRGAFVLAGSSGTVVVGTAPAEADTDAVAQLQTDVAAQPDDVHTLDRLVTIAGELLRNRQYPRVQTTLDDLRATEEDGLHRLNSAPLPTLTAVQREALVHVREAVDQANSAAATGNTVMADAAIDMARQAAQIAVVDATTLPPSVGASVAPVDASQPDPVALAQFGAYLRAVLPKTGLATPLAPPERQLATDLLTSVVFSGTWSDGSAISFTVSRDGRFLSDFRLHTMKGPGACTNDAEAFDPTRRPITNRSVTFTYEGDAPLTGFVLHFLDTITATFTSPQEVHGTLQTTRRATPNVGVDCTGTLAFTATAVQAVGGLSAVPPLRAADTTGLELVRDLPALSGPARRRGRA